ncbi:MAG TPA: nitroreductase [Acidimicrobiales bacterium]|nr:nitroreductase [Acidimicrobiales bacterium]
MDAHQAIVTKRDTRSYLPEPVPEEQLEKVLRSARMAGSAKNMQLTRLVVVTDQADRDGLAECGDFTSWIGSAPVVIVFVVPAETGRMFDVGRMAQNLMVAANAEGLATCPVTFQHQGRIRALLGIPDDHEGTMGVTLGRPGPPSDSPLKSKRVELDDLVHRGRWQG